MSRLVLPADMLARLRAELLSHPRETCAVLFGHACMVDGRLARIVVAETQWVQPQHYTRRSTVRVELRSELVAEIAARARRSGESVVFIHTHPFDLDEFSPIDDQGEMALKDFFDLRTPGIPHAAMLISPHGCRARLLGKPTPLRVMGIGATVTSEGGGISPADEPRYDRQIRAFGAEGQAMLTALRVGIVGLGGTGSVVAQQLAHLGVTHYLLLDPDTVEPSNLNRLVGAGPADVGRAKVDVAGDLIRRIQPAASVRAATQSVLLASVARRLADIDFLFCCTDSHGSRAVLNQLVFQYLVPAIDLGVAIVAQEGRVANIAGRVQMLAPGLACLTCGNYLDAEQVRRDLLTDFERQADPYIVGARLVQPAVISINSAVASLAVTMFLNAVTGIPGTARLLNYNGLVGAVRPAAARCHPTCVVCSSAGALARGNSWPLPARLD